MLSADKQNAIRIALGLGENTQLQLYHLQHFVRGGYQDASAFDDLREELAIKLREDAIQLSGLVGNSPSSNNLLAEYRQKKSLRVASWVSLLETATPSDRRRYWGYGNPLARFLSERTIYGRVLNELANLALIEEPGSVQAIVELCCNFNDIKTLLYFIRRIYPDVAKFVVEELLVLLERKKERNEKTSKMAEEIFLRLGRRNSDIKRRLEEKLAELRSPVSEEPEVQEVPQTQPKQEVVVPHVDESIGCYVESGSLVYVYRDNDKADSNPNTGSNLPALLLAIGLSSMFPNSINENPSQITVDSAHQMHVASQGHQDGIHSRIINKRHLSTARRFSAKAKAVFVR